MTNAMDDDPIGALPAADARELLKRVRSILWPPENPDEQWSPDHIDAISQVFADLRARRTDQPAQRRRLRSRRTYTVVGTCDSQCHIDHVRALSVEAATARAVAKADQCQLRPIAVFHGALIAEWCEG